MVIKYNYMSTLSKKRQRGTAFRWSLFCEQKEVNQMEKTQLNLKTPNGGFCIDVLAGTEFEEEILSVLDKYADRIHASEFY